METGGEREREGNVQLYLTALSLFRCPYSFSPYLAFYFPISLYLAGPIPISPYFTVPIPIFQLCEELVANLRNPQFALLLNDRRECREVVKLRLFCHALFRYSSIDDEPPVSEVVENGGKIARVPVN